MYDHPITLKSFSLIDAEIGKHQFTAQEYAIVRRIIHSTADFEFKDLVTFSPGAIDATITALQERSPIITDVTMVRQGIAGLVNRTFQNPLVTAIEQIENALPGKTRTETGILHCLDHYPQAIYVIGNAPTALLALCDQIQKGNAQPALVIGAPVGFVAVVEAKQALAETGVPQIRVEGRKGGSAVAAAIVNALLILSMESCPNVEEK
jgi:precorrin-8X/cobalt-precorrin-8 methylmutase